MDFLASTSSSLDIKNSIGETLAHAAAKNNKVSVLKFLFSEGIKIHTKNGVRLECWKKFLSLR